MNTQLKHFIIATLTLAIFAAPVLTFAADTEPAADSWQFVGEFYLWAPDINGESAAGDDFEISFSDIMDTLDGAFMGKLAAVKGKWSLIGDFIYLDLEDNTTGTANIIGRPEPTKTDVTLTAYIGTLLGGYTVFSNETIKVDMLAGARYYKLEADIDFDLGAIIRKTSESGDNWDGIVGLAGRINLTPQWFLSGYADIGSGDSELTWQAQGAAGYRFGKFDAVLGYRYLDYEFDDPEIIDNMNIGGPYAGFRYHF